MPGYGTTGTETGAYDATAWNTGAEAPAQPEAGSPTSTSPPPEPGAAGVHVPGDHRGYAYEATQAVVVDTGHRSGRETGFETESAHLREARRLRGPTRQTPQAHEAQTTPEAYELPEVTSCTRSTTSPPRTMPVTATPRSARRTATKAPAAGRRQGGSGSGGSSRRRSPAKRSALLTVAVPSACVMGVAGVAAASVGGLTGTDRHAEEPTTTAAPDPASVKPVAANTKLDTQLVALSADADDFARPREPHAGAHRPRSARKRRRRRRRRRPRARRPPAPSSPSRSTQHGLSAYFGQAGVNWMSVHTGIDFPVSYGTPVMAATDGTVRTQ